MRLLRGIGTVKPEKKEALLEALHTIIEASRKDDGVLEYGAYQSLEDPNTFLLVEIYRDTAAQESHMNQPHTQAFSGKLEQFLAAPPDIKIIDGALEPA